MKLRTMSNGYTTGKVYAIWDIPYDEMNYYELWRNGVIIQQTELDNKGVPVGPTAIHTDLEDANPFVHPCLFDHDHHTHLFWKDSNHQMMFIDEEVFKYQEYWYLVIGKRINENGDVMDEIRSNVSYVEVE